MLILFPGIFQALEHQFKSHTLSVMDGVEGESGAEFTLQFLYYSYLCCPVGGAKTHRFHKTKTAQLQVNVFNKPSPSTFSRLPRGEKQILALIKITVKTL